MNKQTAMRIIVAISLSVLILRLILAFTTPHFTYDSYFHLRQVEHITQTGTPLFLDPLSYTGTTHYFLPLFHYLVALFALIINLEIVAKIVPNLLFAFLPLLVFKISHNITKNEMAGVMAGLVAGFLPVLYNTNEFSPLSLTLVLFAITLHFFLKAKTNPIAYVGAFFLLTLSSPVASILILTFACYTLFLSLEERKIEKYEAQIMLFSLFFFLWIQFIFFKQVLLTEGLAIVLGSVPQELLASYFPKISLWVVLSIIGVLPISAAVYVVYHSLFDLKYKKAVLFISLALAVGILLLFQIVSTQIAYPLLALACAPLVAVAYTKIQVYTQQTKSHFSTKALALITLGCIVLTLIIPSFIHSQAQEIPSKEDVSLFLWAQAHLPEQATIAALVEEGHLVTYLSQRKNIIDTQFAGQNQVQERFEDAASLYTTQFETHALEITEKYNITYLIMSARAQTIYNRERPPFAQSECLKKIKEAQKARIYQVTCTLETNK